jgi:hypothetical protein
MANRTPESPPTPPQPERQTFEVIILPDKFRVHSAEETQAETDGEGQGSHQDQGQQTEVICYYKNLQ